MKKILLLVVGMLAVGMQSVNAQLAIAALHHQGAVTIYGSTEIQNAMNALVQGDTVYLSAGTFPGFNVPTPCVVIGSGVNTVVAGTVTINSNGGEASGFSFAGLQLSNGFVDVSSATTRDLSIDQCMCKSMTFYGTINRANITRCYLQGTDGIYVSSDSIEAFVVSNSKMYTTKGSSSVEYLNCNILQAQAGLCTQCIVRDAMTPCTNCLYNGQYMGSTLVNCWNVSGVDSSTYDTTLTNEELVSGGYLGIDGTVVGITGGNLPYTLDLATPHVTSKNIAVDNDNKVLNVTLTIE